MDKSTARDPSPRPHGEKVARAAGRMRGRAQPASAIPVMAGLDPAIHDTLLQ